MSLVRLQSLNTNSAVQQWALALGKPNARPLFLLPGARKRSRKRLLSRCYEVTIVKQKIGTGPYYSHGKISET